MAFLSEVERHFKLLAERDRLGHAYLFFGEGAAGGAAIARKLAAFLEGGAWEENARPPIDAMLLERIEGSFGIDDVRDARRFLAGKPFIAARRTLLVAPASALTLQAEHAFLKAVEEPGPRALIIMIARNPAELLPTLVSRFQKFYISGERRTELSSEERELLQTFLRGDRKKRSEFLKGLGETPGRLEQFVQAMMLFLWRNEEREYGTLRELLSRYAAINQYTVNTKLQLEAALLGVQGDASH